MKLKADQVARFVAKPDPAVAAMLFYGPDRGMVRERAQAIVAATVPDPDDPFNVAVLDAASLAADPARLADEAGALSLAGGRRVVWVQGGNKAVAGLMPEVLETIDPASVLIVVEAAELGQRDALRKLFEDADAAIALPCYLDEGRGLAEVIRQSLSAHGLSLEPEALTYLVEHLGSDRLVTRSELEKLALYKAGDTAPISLEEAVACVGDGAPYLVDDVVLAAAGGDQLALDRALGRCWQAGESPVGILRAMLRHIQRLHLAAGRVAKGQSPAQVVRTLRPPVFWKHQPILQGQLRQWSPGRLGKALELLLEAELQCKSTGMPDRAILARALMRIAQAARAGAG